MQGAALTRALGASSKAVRNRSRSPSACERTSALRTSLNRHSPLLRAALNTARVRAQTQRDTLSSLSTRYTDTYMK
eukprot:2575644-Pleurochrysis_carterae.AAC.1